MTMRRHVALRLGLIASLAGGMSAPGAARDLMLGLPLDCTLGETCFVQNYVDHDPGPGAADFTCGGLSYDDHKGTDFAIPDRRAMRAGVDVLAAAPGRIRATRDQWPDIAFGSPGAPDLKGQDCGNGVLIDHGGGWETQYCHMKQGSISVKPGQRVAKGAVLGQVGLSGRSEFPHLHLSLRHDGGVIDPFDAGPITSCGGAPARSLWQNTLPYSGGGIIAIGVAPHMPDFTEVRDGRAGWPVVPAKAPALVLWAHVFGARAGDRLHFRLQGPDGIVVQGDAALAKSQARLFRATGTRLKGAQWPAGTYRGTVTMRRGKEGISRRVLSIRVEG